MNKYTQMEPASNLEILTLLKFCCNFLADTKCNLDAMQVLVKHLLLGGLK